MAHKKSDRTAMLVLNGAVLAAGGLLIAKAASSEPTSCSDASCAVGNGLGNAGVLILGGVIGTVGLVGFTGSLYVPDDVVVPMGAPPPPATITAPGLQPATITLR